MTIVMGVTGAGKSTHGAARAAAEGARFIEGDALHFEGNRAKLARGEQLTDADRAPWLASIGEAATAARKAQPVVVTCSALRRSYRNALRAAIAPPLRFVFLDVPAHELARRLRARTGHFASPALLASQLATLEDPAGEGDVERVQMCSFASSPSGA